MMATRGTQRSGGIGIRGDEERKKKEVEAAREVN